MRSPEHLGHDTPARTGRTTRRYAECIVHERIGVAVIGGGQAGLAVSHELGELGVEHVVLERGRVGQTWRDRWDSFCLVTPNWSVQLPGGEYAGDKPDGYMARDEVVAHLVQYADSFAAPVHEGVEVSSLSAAKAGGFALTTSEGALQADRVVLTTGAYQQPRRPAGAARLPRRILQLDAQSYTNEAALPAGRVLVVGSGQTGCQLAEELHQVGRDVVLACGRAPWCTRRIGGRDLVHWIAETGMLDETLDDLPSPSRRLVANVQATGHDGGHDLHFRVLQEMGVTLVGHFLGVDDTRFNFASDLADSVAFGDARYNEMREKVATLCAARGIPMPDMPEPTPFDARAPASVPLADFGAVIFTSGFRPDYSRWVHFDAFDAAGFPIHQDGASTTVPGLYFCGVHFLRKRKSSLLFGVGEDATIVARRVAEDAATATVHASG
jgi:putative flavoprotein involved in K+ transport